ncbi:MAG TPA: plastocyanin/azurin family copper-binding protein [Candidatus Binataceae bacterium]
MRITSLLLAAALSIGSNMVALAASPDSNSGAVVGTVTVGGHPTSDVVISLEGIPPDSEKNPHPAAYQKQVTMSQRDLKFFPYVLPVVVGTTVEFPNDDQVWHNIFSDSKVKKFDLGLYGPGKSKTVTFDTPGVVRILCNVHPTMEAYIVVEDHLNFASPDTRGNYRFEGIPLGSYHLQVWHPSLGIKTESFTLERAGEVERIDVNL